MRKRYLIPIFACILLFVLLHGRPLPTPETQTPTAATMTTPPGNITITMATQSISTPTEMPLRLR